MYKGIDNKYKFLNFIFNNYIRIIYWRNKKYINIFANMLI